MPAASVIFAVTVLVLTGRLSLVILQARQQADKSVWDGVYTAPQAMRGKADYATYCSSCHYEDLSGARGRLKGDRFMQDWREDNLNSLFTRIRATMPFDNPSSLSDRAYVDIVAYILQENGFPSGAEELTAEVVGFVRVEESRGGSATAPNFALVQVVGCLARRPDNQWILTNAREPVRTRDPAASSQEELKQLEARPLGTQTVRLLDVYPSPDSHNGHRVEVKGLLIRLPSEVRVNVTSLLTVGATCGP